MNHQFSVIIDKTPESNDEILAVADALGDADCLDASIGGHREGIEALFNRDVVSLDDAIKSAVSAIEKPDSRSTRVEVSRDSISLET